MNSEIICLTLYTLNGMLIRYEISLDDDKCLVINSSYLSHQWLLTLQATLTHKGILFHEIFRNSYCQFVCNSFSIQIAELYNTRKTNLHFIGASYTHIMKRKLKHWWSSIPTISTKQSYQQNNHLSSTQKYHSMRHWKSRSWLGTGTQMWRG